MSSIASTPSSSVHRGLPAEAKISSSATLRSRAPDVIAHLGPETTIGELRQIFGNATITQISRMSGAARAVVLGTREPQQAAVLGLATGVAGVASAAAAASKPHKLTGAEIKAMSAPGPQGVGLKGEGTFKGELRIVDGRVEIVTGGKGSKSETSFKISVPVAKARQFEGQRVDVHGIAEKKNQWFGEISSAKITSHDRSIRVGSYHEFSGKVVIKKLFGPGGEAPPSGSYLVLSKPVRIGGKQVRELFVGDEDLKQGSRLKLNGRVDVGSYGGVETRRREYLKLTGVTNSTVGEPRFDGHHFTNAKGEQLQALYYTRPMLYDAPAVLFVPDYASNKVFIGANGGMIPPGMNPFHGFRDVGGIRQADPLDRAQIKVQGDKVLNADGKELTKVGEHSMGPQVADGIYTAWYYDVDAKAIYELQSGGIAGLQHAMTRVFDVGPKAPREAVNG